MRNYRLNNFKFKKNESWCYFIYFRYRIMRFCLTIIAILICLHSFEQKANVFCGKLVYDVEEFDSISNERISKIMVIYTNDTLLRIENETIQLGKQVLFKHLLLNKSYLLLETGRGKFAVQTNHNIEKEEANPYKFQKHRFKQKKIAGVSSRKLIVYSGNSNIQSVFYYSKKWSNKYLNMPDGFPGLLTSYCIVNAAGRTDYRLKSMEQFLPDKKLFEIPEAFKKISFSDFVELMMDEGN